MSEKIKVSELQESTTTNDDDLIMIVQENSDNELENFKQTRANFLEGLSMAIKELTENLVLTNGNVPSLDDGYYYTGSYHVTINGTTATNLDNSIFYFTKNTGTYDFLLEKIWVSAGNDINVMVVSISGQIGTSSGDPLMGTQLVTSISSSSTNKQIPSAKCVYDIVGDIETALDTIQGEVI